MKTLAVFAVVAVVMAAANPLSSLAAQDPQFVLTKDFSIEDGHEYSVKYVRPYTPGRNVPLLGRRLGSSEELSYYLASQQGKGLTSWSDRVKGLRQVLATGVDVSDENFRRTFSVGAKLPTDRQYYVDSSGEIYYEPGQPVQQTYRR